MILLLPWKPLRRHSTHIRLFERNQRAIKCRCIMWKIVHNGPILIWSYPNLYQALFFRTQCSMLWIMKFSTTWKLRVILYSLMQLSWSYKLHWGRVHISQTDGGGRGAACGFVLSYSVIYFLWLFFKFTKRHSSKWHKETPTFLTSNLCLKAFPTSYC